MSITEEQLQTILAASLKTALAAVGSSASDEKPRVKCPERPVIDLGCSETNWAFFLDEWNLYKRRASLTPGQLSDELRTCCSKELRKNLFDFVGSSTLSSLGEEDLLKQIKSSAVIGKNKAVHRKEFYEFQQAPDEPVNRFVANLRAKAERCNFTQSCTANGCHQTNSYADQMVKDQMIYGLADKDIQQEVLSKDKQLSTFKQTYDLIEAYELGKLAKSQLDHRSSSEVNAFRNQQQLSSEKQATTCSGCGSADHNGQPRERECPAWGERCWKCGKFNHFGRVCQQGHSDDTKPKRSNEKPSYGAAISWDDYDNENTSWFLAFRSEQAPNVNNNHTLPHVEWNGETFVEAKPSPLPSIEVKITPLLEFHEQFFSQKFQTDIRKSVAVAFTDTCAETCVAGAGVVALVYFLSNKIS